MPYSDLAVATMEWNETGTWRYLRPRYVERVPACQHSCPTSNDIEAWIRLFEQGRIDEAWDAATLENPFPSIMGRVCFHPCMDACNRAELGGAVNIQMLERCLGDAMGDRLPAVKPFCPPTRKKIAVVGSGPAGLACAYHLRRLGHGVTVFERSAKAGGMLRYGIPAYRLPREVLDLEIARLAKMEIEILAGKPVRDAAHMQTLRQDFDAVFIAIGAHRSRNMDIPNEKTLGTTSGLEFLRQVAEGRPTHIGKKVLVVGGGNTAVDAARCAKRLGAEVTIVYRRGLAEMPAFGDEIREAGIEGIAFELLASPQRVLVRDGRTAGLKCVRNELGTPDESGRRLPVAIAGSDFVLDADTVLAAVGEEIETVIIPSALPIKSGAIKTHGGGQTEWSNIFAGGDCTDSPRTVVDALMSGKRSAIAIDCFLRGESADVVFEEISVADAAFPSGRDATRPVYMSLYLRHLTGNEPPCATTSKAVRQDRVVTAHDLNLIYFERSEPAVAPHLAREERFGKDSFAEIHGAVPEEVSKHELVRCFHCGRCNECDNCFIYCPDVAIEKKDGGFDLDLYYCKGCGVCMNECPRAAIEMIEEPTEL